MGAIARKPMRFEERHVALASGSTRWLPGERDGRLAVDMDGVLGQRDGAKLARRPPPINLPERQARQVAHSSASERARVGMRLIAAQRVAGSPAANLLKASVSRADF